MNEFYFVTKGGKYERATILGFRLDGNKWHKFWEVPRTGEPFITADGQTMHLAKGYRLRTPFRLVRGEKPGPDVRS